jgi:cell division protein FtsL
MNLIKVGFINLLIMKKIILFSLAFILMGSYGGIIGSAHAQSLSPATAVEMNQQLQAAKTELLNLQTQVGTSVSAPTAEAALSAQDLASLQMALNALDVTLLQIERVAVAQNGILTPQQKTVVGPALSNISANLTNIASAISLPESQSSGIAQAPENASQKTIGGPLVAQNPSGIVAGVSVTPANLSESQAAIISSHIPMSRKVEIGLGILVLVAIVALAWPRHKEKKSNTQSSRKMVSPAAIPVATPTNILPSSQTNPSSGNQALKSVAVNTQQKPISGSNQKPA